MTDERGAALIDIIVASTLSVTLAAIAVPVIGGTLDRERTIVGAKYLAGQLLRARLESLNRARAVAIRFELVDGRTRFQLFADGNGNGVLQRDIDRRIDQQQQLHHAVRRRRRRLDDEDVPAARVLVDAHENLTVRKAADRPVSQRHPQLIGNLLGERLIRRPAEKQHRCLCRVLGHAFDGRWVAPVREHESPKS